jgi:hypothetical protein
MAGTEKKTGQATVTDLQRIRALPHVPKIVFNGKFQLVNHYCEEMIDGTTYRLRVDWTARMVWAEHEGTRSMIGIPFEKLTCAVFPMGAA